MKRESKDHKPVVGKAKPKLTKQKTTQQKKSRVSAVPVRKAKKSKPAPKKIRASIPALPPAAIPAVTTAPVVRTASQNVSRSVSRNMARTASKNSIVI